MGCRRCGAETDGIVCRGCEGELCLQRCLCCGSAQFHRGLCDLCSQEPVEAEDDEDDDYWRGSEEDDDEDEDEDDFF